MQKKPFTSNTNEIRAKARQHIEDGAVTDGYRANREQIIEMLNSVLATEIVCNLRYKNHYFLASGIHSEAVAAEFLEHAKQEEEHANKVSRRIVQLNGKPDWSPDSLTKRSHADYVAGISLTQMIKENLIAERIAVETYREMVAYIGDDDPTTRRIIEEILAQEEEHADEMANLLKDLGDKI